MLSEDAYCETSSYFTKDTICPYGHDGTLYYKGFRSGNEGNGVTFNITFSQEYTITYGRILNSLDWSTSIKDLQIVFQQELSIQVIKDVKVIFV